MNPTRRSLCGLGIASVPLAMLRPGFLPSAQESAERVDPLLAYLVEDTRRNCRLARRPGRERAKPLRSLGANLDVLTVYLHTRYRVARIENDIRQRVHDEGAETLVQRVREKWPAVEATVARDYAVTLPEQPDHRSVSAAIENLERYGCPRLGGLRGWFEREADRIEQWEGRVGASVLVRQTPGNDFGPPGWSAGIGDPTRLSCWDLGVLMAGLLAVEEFLPETAVAIGPLLAILGVIYAIACGSRST